MDRSRGGLRRGLGRQGLRRLQELILAMRRALALLPLAAVLGLPAIGLAGSSDLGTVAGFNYRSDFAAAGGPAEAAKGSAGCGAGTHVVGGGASLPWTGFQAHLNRMYPRDGADANPKPDDAYVLRAWNATGPAPAAGDVYVICRSGDVTYRDADTRVAAGRGRVVGARCPSGMHVSGGGVHLSGRPRQAFINSSYPFDGQDADAAADDGWRARVYNLSGATKTATAHAICVERSFEYWSGGNAFGGSPTRNRETTCPSGHLASPGLRLSGPASEARPTAVYPRDSQVFNTDPDSIPDDEAAQSAGNLEGGDKVLFGFAICT